MNSELDNVYFNRGTIPPLNPLLSADSEKLRIKSNNSTTKAVLDEK